MRRSGATDHFSLSTYGMVSDQDLADGDAVGVTWVLRPAYLRHASSRRTTPTIHGEDGLYPGGGEYRDSGNGGGPYPRRQSRVPSVPVDLTGLSSEDGPPIDDSG